ncbi:MAG: ABC transporter substrate-binding protein [Burkholderiaceae bacterium]
MMAERVQAPVSPVPRVMPGPGRSRRRLLVAGASLLAGAIGLVPAAPAAQAPQRIVSVGADMTELVYALGAGERVVATDTTSLWPPQARETRKLGYLRNLSAEGLLSLEPDLLLLSGAAGPESTLRQLEGTGLRIVQAVEDYSLAGARAKIELVGKALGEEARARELVAEFDRDVAVLRETTRSVAHPRGVFLLAAGGGSPQVAGKGTAAQAILDLVGVDNALDHEGYKAISPEALVAARPEVILVMSTAPGGGIEAVAATPGMALTPAGKAGRMLEVDGVALMSFGPRVAKAATQLAGRVRKAATQLAGRVRMPAGAAR